MKETLSITVDIRDNDGGIIRTIDGNKALSLDWKVDLHLEEDEKMSDVIGKYLTTQGKKLQAFMPDRKIEVTARTFNAISNTWPEIGCYYVSQDKLIV